MDSIIVSAIEYCLPAELCYILALVFGRFLSPWYIFSGGAILQCVGFVSWFRYMQDTGTVHVAFYDFFVYAIWFLLVTVLFAVLCWRFARKRRAKS